MRREEECVEEVGCCWEMGSGIPGGKLLVGMGREGNDWRKGCWKKTVREASRRSWEEECLEEGCMWEMGRGGNAWR